MRESTIIGKVPHFRVLLKNQGSGSSSSSLSMKFVSEQICTKCVDWNHICWWAEGYEAAWAIPVYWRMRLGMGWSDNLMCDNSSCLGHSSYRSIGWDGFIWYKFTRLSTKFLSVAINNDLLVLLSSALNSSSWTCKCDPHTESLTFTSPKQSPPMVFALTCTICIKYSLFSAESSPLSVSKMTCN